MTGSATVRNAGRELSQEIAADADLSAKAMTELMKTCTTNGQMSERAAIVAWLRENWTLARVAEAIEAGEHRK